jgi:DNA-directed RNA polymerase specialized sigma24 family protein
MEYESPINEYRVASGLTHRELSAQSGVPMTTIHALANGMLSPIKENGSGHLRNPARKLCEFFQVGPEELFPRYICSLNRSYKFDIQPYETWSERAANNFREQLENSDLARLLIKIAMADATLREKRVLAAYLFNDETFEEIADKEGVTTTRVTQNYRKALKRIVVAAVKIGLPVSPKKMPSPWELR